MTSKLFKPLHVFLLLLLALLIATLIFPSTREAHCLCFRLLFHLNGKTTVRGQPDGCDLFVLPNVQFTKECQQQLRANSNSSLDDYLLATATGDYFDLEVPQPTAIWTNHTALQWAAFRFAQAAIIKKSYPTNPPSLSSIGHALETVRLAQFTAPTNGALWLVEAAIKFGNDDEAALAALRIAAQKTPWNADSDSSLPYTVQLLDTAGLSHLDAVIWASYYYNSDLPILSIQGEIKRHLDRLMTNAIIQRDDQQFSSLLGLLVDLRRVNWADGNVDVRNVFRSSYPSDTLFNAMTNRLGIGTLSITRDMRMQVRDNYFKTYADPSTVSAFQAQKEAWQTENQLRRKIISFQSDPILWAGLNSTFSGGAALLMLTFLFISMFMELPLLWLRRHGPPPGILPTAKSFWLLMAALFVFVFLLFTNLLLSIGAFTQLGLHLEEKPPMISPFFQAMIASSVVGIFITTALLICWKKAKQAFKAWEIASPFLLTNFAYLMAILIMAYFRSQAATEVLASHL